MKRLYLLIFSAFVSLVVGAQGEGGGADINVDINKGGSGGGSGFMGNPVVWVVGAAVFILLLVALLRRRG